MAPGDIVETILATVQGGVNPIPPGKLGYMSESSQYKGVSWHRSNKRWRAKIRIYGRDINLGHFSCEAEAGKVWDIAARILRGPGADENFHGVLPETVTAEDVRVLLRRKKVVA